MNTHAKDVLLSLQSVVVDDMKYEGERKKMILLMLFDFSRKWGLKFGVWGTPKGKWVWGWGEGWGGWAVRGKERVEGGVRKISGNFPGNLDRDGEGPSVQKLIL